MTGRAGETGRAGGYWTGRQAGNEKHVNNSKLVFEQTGNQEYYDIKIQTEWPQNNYHVVLRTDLVMRDWPARVDILPG